MSNKRKFLLSGKHIPHFRIISKSHFPLKLSSSVQISLCGFGVCEREES